LSIRFLTCSTIAVLSDETSTLRLRSITRALSGRDKNRKKKLFGWIWLPRIYPRLFLLPIPTWRWLLGFCFYDEYPSCLYCTNSNLRPFSSVSDAIDCDCISSWWFLVVFEAQHGGLTSKCTCYDGGRGGKYSGGRSISGICLSVFKNLTSNTLVQRGLDVARLGHASRLAPSPPPLCSCYCRVSKKSGSDVFARRVFSLHPRASRAFIGFMLLHVACVFGNCT